MNPTLIKEPRHPRSIDAPTLDSPDFSYLQMLYRLRPKCRGTIAYSCEREIRRARSRIHVH